MKFKDLIKTTEGLVVLGGLLLTVLFGKFFAIATGIIYVMLKVPSVEKWIENKLKKWF